MRRAMRALAMGVVLMLGVGAASAQLLDTSTGMLVDPGTDPADYSAVMSGQPGNFTMELAMDAQAQAQEQAQEQQDSEDFMNSTSASNQPSDDDSAAAAPPAPTWPVTAKPEISPNGGKVAAGTEVTISDADAGAILFYTTDGSKPTPASPRYDGPFAVSADEKVQALGFDLSEQPSSVAAETFAVKN